MEKKLDIRVWSDFACPFCYIGETRLEKVLRKMHLDGKATVTYKAYELDPQASDRVGMTMVERFCEEHGLTVQQAEQRMQDIMSIAREAGIDMHLATAQYASTFDAHRLMKFAQATADAKTVARLNESLFDAYFVKNLVIADHLVLLNLATAVGLKEGDVLDVLNSDKYADDVRADEAEAERLNVEEVPYMLIDGRHSIYGALSDEGLEVVLRKALDDPEKGGKPESDKPQRGHTCGPNGCEID